MVVRARGSSGRMLARTLALFATRPVTSVPSRILFAPETSREADPVVAQDIYAGVFAFAGEVADVAGGSPFDVPPPSDDWARTLHSFSWLVHLEANATALSSTNARALFDDWVSREGRHGPIAAELDVKADRITAWLVEAPLLLNGAPAEFRTRYLRALGRQLRRLERAIGRVPPGVLRLKAASTLALAGVCVADEARLMRTGLSLVAGELAAQILPDGGHRTRSPDALLAAAAAALPLREALLRRRLEVPQAISEALDRMVLMVRFLRMGDGHFVGLHGAGALSADDIDAVLAFDDLSGAPLSNARYSGFQRLVDGEALVVMDTGTAPPPGFADAAHASALAFEFSHGAYRIIVGCGPLGAAREEWTDVARETAAHSTLQLADVSSARIVGPGWLTPFLGTPLVAGPGAVNVERTQNTVTASHDGYRARFGLDHARSLSLLSDGLTLAGEDRLTGEGRLDNLTFHLRFHLGPDVKVRLHASRRQAVLSLPDESLWVFTVAEGPTIAVEDSIAVIGPGRAHRNVQLVVSGSALSDHTIRWHLARRADPLERPPDDTEDPS